MVAPSLAEKPVEKSPMPEVVVAQPTPQPAPEWGKGSMIVAAFGFLCCQLMGLPALIMSIFSYVDHSNGFYTESNKKSTRARRLGAAAIVLGTLILLGMVAWHFCPKNREMMKKWKHGKHEEGRMEMKEKWDMLQERREFVDPGFGMPDNDLDRHHKKPCPRPHPHPGPHGGGHHRPEEELLRETQDTLPDKK